MLGRSSARWSGGATVSYLHSVTQARCDESSTCVVKLPVVTSSRKSDDDFFPVYRLISKFVEQHPTIEAEFYVPTNYPLSGETQADILDSCMRGCCEI